VIGRRKKKPAVLTPVVERTDYDTRGRREQSAPLREVARFGHGSRVPGWDDAVDLEKNPAEVPDPATTPVPAPLRAEIEAHMAKYPDFHSAAIPALAAAQRVHGWCSPEAIWQAACVMRLTPGYLISVASFYDMLETTPVGRHSVYVCTNISCSLCGADELLAAIEQEVGGDPEFNVRHFECLGACDIAPMASVDGVYVGPIDLDEVPRLVEQIRDGTPPLPGKQLHLRKSTDPGAARAAIAGAADPVSPTHSAGPPMGGGPVGPPAAIERPPATEDEDDA
jgi:NADH:ubiquinone oxidoreductase subunit E